MKKLFLLFVLIWSIGYSQSLKLPAVISDNMMLQQKMAVPIWGWSKAGNTVTVSGSWDNEKKQVVADSSGKWTTTLTTPAAGGPYTITVTSDTKIVVKNVLIGEVWVCSGQSNMEMNFKGWGNNSPVEGADKTIKGANYPDIRLFKVLVIGKYVRQLP
jgi:sialate O-acetylesterase